MSLWTMVAIIVVAGVIGDVLKQRYKAKGNSEKTAEIIDEKTRRIESEMEVLRKRVRNLEAIAATAPDEFRASGSQSSDFTDLGSDDVDAFNERLVNQLARRKRTS